MIAKSAAKRRKDIWDHSSAGRALALQARGHRFEPCWSHSSGQTEYGGVAQLARAHGSYPWCQEFESPLRYARYCAGKAKVLICAVLVCSQCHPLRFGSTWLISAHYQKFMAWEIASLFFSLLSRLKLPIRSFIIKCRMRNSGISFVTYAQKALPSLRLSITHK